MTLPPPVLPTRSFAAPSFFGIRFTKVQPTACLLQYNAGRLKREGVGLAFRYYAPTTSLSPCASLSPARCISRHAVSGKVTAREPLIVSSQMAGHGVIFSDGIESDFLDFNSGTEARITLAERKSLLVL